MAVVCLFLVNTVFQGTSFAYATSRPLHDALSTNVRLAGEGISSDDNPHIPGDLSPEQFHQFCAARQQVQAVIDAIERNVTDPQERQRAIDAIVALRFKGINPDIVDIDGARARGILLSLNSLKVTSTVDPVGLVDAWIAQATGPVRMAGGGGGLITRGPGGRRPGTPGAGMVDTAGPLGFTFALDGDDFPLMIEAGEEELRRMFEPTFGERAGELAKDVLGKDIEAPRRGIGQRIAEGKLTLVKDGEKFDENASDVSETNVVPAANRFVRAGLKKLLEKQEIGVVRDCLNRAHERQRDITLDYRQDHDRLLNLSPLTRLKADEQRNIIIDTDVPAELDRNEENREGLTLVYSMGLLHQLYRIAGVEPGNAILKVFEFYECLEPEEQNAVKKVLGNDKIDNAERFREALIRAADAEDPVKFHQAAALRHFTLTDLPYADRKIAGRVLDSQGKPMVTQLGLKEARERAHKGVDATYSHELEQLNVERISAEAQEKGMELVMGYLGRAGLIEQLLMSAATTCPTEELIEPFMRIFEEFETYKLEMETDEFKELEKEWGKLGIAQAELERIRGLLGEPEVAQKKLETAIDGFRAALYEFQDKCRTLVDKAMREKREIIAEEIKQSGDEEVSETAEKLKRDIAKINEVVNKFWDKSHTELELAAVKVPHLKKVVNVAIQRIFEHETLNLFLLSRLLDPYLGETLDFRELLNDGMPSLHVTADIGPWLRKVSTWIQALPAYAWYKVYDLQGDDYRVLAGCERDTLEFAIKDNIDNMIPAIEEVMHLEHVALARTYLAERMGPEFKQKVDEVVEYRKGLGETEDVSREEAIRSLFRDMGLNDAVANLATLVDATYHNLEDEVTEYMAEHEYKGIEGRRPRPVDRITALMHVIRQNDDPEGNLVRDLLPPLDGPIEEPDEDGSKTKAAAEALVRRHNLNETLTTMSQFALLRRKDPPCYHNLTTLGPGEARTYLKTWLETGMTLRLFCRDHNLDDRVNERVAEYKDRVSQAALRVIEDLDLDGDLAEMMIEQGLDPTNLEHKLKTAPKLTAQYTRASQQVGRLCAITEYEERVGLREKPKDGKIQPIDKEPESVKKYMKEHRDELRDEAVRHIVRHYGLSEEVARIKNLDRSSWIAAAKKVLWELTQNDQALAAEYGAEMGYYKRYLARQAVADELDLELDATNKSRGYLRLHHPMMALSTARQEVVSEYIKENEERIKKEEGVENALDVLNKAKYRYESEGPYTKFYLAYTPSRVDLGEGERHSVEGIGKVVSSDTLAGLKRASELHELYNVGTIKLPAMAMAEFFKARENFFTRGGPFYLSLGEGINVDAIMRGDVEGYMYYSNLRGDRLHHPGGSIYGGFCVPKEFFLIYAVLMAGVDREVATDVIMNFAPAGYANEFKRLIDDSYGTYDKDRGVWNIKEGSFLGDLRKSLDIEAEDAVDWKGKASEFFAGRYEHYFDVMTNKTYQSREGKALDKLQETAKAHFGTTFGMLPDLAEALHNWAITTTEEERETRELLLNIANWANKKMQGMEMINRMGADRMIELVTELVDEAEARRRKAGLPVKDRRKYKSVIGGPYKRGERVKRRVKKRVRGREVEKEVTEDRPITDSRMSLAARWTRALADADKVWDPETEKWVLREFDPHGRRVIERIRERMIIPADFRIAGTVTADDILTAFPDWQPGEMIDAVKERFEKEGANITEDQMKAYCTDYATDLEEWPIPQSIRKRLLRDEQFMRRLHLLVLEERGVIDSYREAIQGADIFILSVADPEFLELLDNLPELVYRAEEANEEGLIVLADGPVGGRMSAFATLHPEAKYKVQELFAIRDDATYGCLGKGSKDISQAWRDEMYIEREQAEMLRDALIKADYDTARTLFAEMVGDVRDYDKAQKAQAMAARSQRSGSGEPFFRGLARCLTNVKDGLPIERLDFATWLGLGGRFLLNGKMTEAEFAEERKIFEDAMRQMREAEGDVEPPRLIARVDVDEVQKQLIKPKYEPPKIKEFEAVETGIATVGKVGGERGRALAGRAARRQKMRLQLMLNGRRRAMAAMIAEEGVEPEDHALGAEAAYDKAMETIGDPDSTLKQEQFSKLAYWTRVSCMKVLRQIIPDDAGEERLKKREEIEERIAEHLSGGNIDPDIHRALREDLSHLIDLEAQRLQDAGITKDNITDEDKTNLVTIAKAGELLDICLLVSLEYDIDLAGEINEEVTATQSLFNFFDKTMNAHMFNCFPFLIQPGLSEGSFDNMYSHDSKYDFAWERHRWIYKRVRKIVTERTAMRNKDEGYHGTWLGDVGDWEHPDSWDISLGVNVEGEAKQFWFNYVKLRDAVAMMEEFSGLDNPSALDGVPEVFVDVDPAILGADERGEHTTVAGIYNVGNTTLPVGIEQGVRLAADDHKINFMMCPFPVRTYDAAYGREVLQARDGVMYVSGERYKKLLEASGVPAEQATERAAKVPEDTGILVALKFREPATVDRGDKKAYKGAVTIDAGFLHFTHGLRPYADRLLPISLIQEAANEALDYLKKEVSETLRGTPIASPLGFAWDMEDTNTAREKAREELARTTDGTVTDEQIELHVRAKIRDKLLKFMEKYPTITELIEKPEKESGGRRAELVSILSRRASRRGDMQFVGSEERLDDDLEIKEEDQMPEGLKNLNAMAKYIYDVSLSDNVVVQGVIHSFVKRLFTRKFLEGFVKDKAVLGDAVALDGDQETPLFSYFRIVSSRGTGEEFEQAMAMDIISTEGIGNVARRSILYVYEDDTINQEFRVPLRRAIEGAVGGSLVARRKYLKHAWPHLLREYLALNRRFGEPINEQICEFLNENDNWQTIVEAFFQSDFFQTDEGQEFAGQQEAFMAFFADWKDDFLGEIDGRGFSSTLAEHEQFKNFARPFKEFLGARLQEAELLTLDLHYSMDDVMPMYMGDEDENPCYLYVLEKDDKGNLVYDNWGNVIIKQLADFNGNATDVRLYNVNGNEIPTRTPDGKAIPLRIFNGPEGERQEVEMYDRDVSQMEPEQRELFRISCIEGFIIEYNPAAGLWRPHDMALRKLAKERGGEGVNRIFMPLGERGRAQKEKRLATAQLVSDGELTLPEVQAGYFGAGEDLFLKKLVVEEGTLEFLVETAAEKARQEMDEAADYELTVDDMSIVLMYMAVDDMLSECNAEWDKVKEKFEAEKLNGLLAKPNLSQTVQERLGVDISGLLANVQYMQAVEEAVKEAVHRKKEALGLRIAAQPVSAEATVQLLGNRQNCGLVFDGMDTPFADTVAAFQIDSRKHLGLTDGKAMNFIGVHKDWLTPDGKAATKALVVDRRGLVKKVVFETPVPLHAVGIYNLKRATERQTHEELSKKFKDAGIRVFNPYEDAMTMDSKFETYQRCLSDDQLLQALTERFDQGVAVDANLSRDTLTSHVRKILVDREMLTRSDKPKQVEVVIQPDHGTEGILTESVTLQVVVKRRGGEIELVEDEQLKKALEHIKAIADAKDEAIAREMHGDVTVDGKLVVFRLNAAETKEGYAATTGLAMIAKEKDQAIVSDTAGMDTEDINSVLRKMEYKGTLLYSVLGEQGMNELIENMKDSAERAARALKAKGITGVDLLLDVQEDRSGNINVKVVFLEANPRPALLNIVYRIEPIDPDKPNKDIEPMPDVADGGFFEMAYDTVAEAGRFSGAVEAVATGRPTGQIASIATQTKALYETAVEQGFDPEQGVAVAYAGGRIREFMMHPDMRRFDGPAVQKATGGKDAGDWGQVAVMIQETDDNRIHLHTDNPAYMESSGWIMSDRPYMYPGPAIDDMESYFQFGTDMTRRILKSLNYIPPAEIEARRKRGEWLPPESKWVESNMNRTIALVSNGLASLRTLKGPEGERVQAALGKKNFKGLRICMSGNVPTGGFSSSSSVVVAILNALNAYYNLGLSDDMIVDVAYKAEWGVGTKAGALDHAAIQRGKAGQSLLISSNPSDRYKTLSVFQLQAEGKQILFPFSVDRDLETARWSNGVFAAQSTPEGRPTGVEVRTMTGTAAALASILLELPLDTSFFQEIEEDLITDGELSLENRKKVYGYLRRLPTEIKVDELRQQLYAKLEWYLGQLGLEADQQVPDPASGPGAQRTAEEMVINDVFDPLLANLRDFPMTRTSDDGAGTLTLTGIPLRAMLAYLYGEVGKNMYLLHHQDEYIDMVTRSQRGDCSFNIDLANVPSRDEMEQGLNWEQGKSGPELMEEWLKRCNARPFNYYDGLGDMSLDQKLEAIEQAIATTDAVDPTETQLHLMDGSNFFRGLALIDLIEVMLKKVFDPENEGLIAVRINAAGQGDYFQVHMDTTKVKPEEVRAFMEKNIYRRFDLTPEQNFTEVYPGGPAAGVKVDRLARVEQLSTELMPAAPATASMQAAHPVVDGGIAPVDREKSLDDNKMADVIFEGAEMRMALLRADGQTRTGRRTMLLDFMGHTEKIGLEASLATGDAALTLAQRSLRARHVRVVLDTRVSELVEQYDADNVGKPRGLEGLLEREQVKGKHIGLIASAKLLLDNMGAREALERLAVSEGEFTIVVDCENEEERNAILNLNLPGVEGARVTRSGESKRDRAEALTRILRRKRVLPQNIGMADAPVEFGDLAEAQRALEGLEIYVGIPTSTSTPLEGRTVSVHGVLRNVIHAVTTEQAKKIFVVDLPPIEVPTTDREWQEKLQQFEEAILYLKHA